MRIPSARTYAAAQVDHAFFAQVTTPVNLSFEGIATVAFTASRLVVTVSPEVEWLFSVVKGDANPFATAPEVLVIPVVGLSHYWNLPPGTTHDSLETELFARLCAREESDKGNPACETCEQGGPGAQYCEIRWPGGECSAECGDGYHACCQCPDSCGCCQDSIQLRAQPLVSSAHR